MSVMLEKLRQDHKNLGRLLDLLSIQLDDFFAGKESDFDLKIEMLDYIEHYAESTHHPTEEQINQLLLDKLPEQGHIFSRVSDEHVKLIGLAQRFRKTLEGIIQGEVLLRDEVETRGREFVALQRQHIDLEEEQVFPLVEQTLGSDDWQRLEEKIQLVDDPVFKQQDYNRFRSLIDYLQAQEATK